MIKNYPLFRDVIKKFDKIGLLDEIVIVGSWAIELYKIYFDDDIYLPSIKTMDIDILCPQHLKHKKVDLSREFESLGFELYFDYPSMLTKLIHPEIEIEFMVNKIAEGNVNPVKIDKLSVYATALRFLSILEDNILIISFDEIKVKTPMPSAFVLHKFIISQRRKEKLKAQKDIENATDIGEYILEIDEQRLLLKNVFESLHPKWQKNILDITKQHSNKIYTFLK